MCARRDEAKLRENLPIYEDQERAWKQLVDEGFAGRLQAEERKRRRIEAGQELKGQVHTIEAARATIQPSRERIAQIESTHRQELYSEGVATPVRCQTRMQESQKQAHRDALLELKAPQEGTIKDLATHTEGAGKPSA
jgi:HlyD family secretion protein